MVYFICRNCEEWDSRTRHSLATAMLADKGLRSDALNLSCLPETNDSGLLRMDGVTTSMQRKSIRNGIKVPVFDPIVLRPSLELDPPLGGDKLQ